MNAILRSIAGRLPPGLIGRVGAWQTQSRLGARLLAPLSRRMTAGDSTIGRGAGAGLRFNAAGTNPGYVIGTTEPLVQQELVAMCEPGATVYDVGANVGFFTILAARFVGEQGRVVAFEPIPPFADALRHNIGLNDFTNVTVLQTAVGRSRGQAEFMIGDVPGGSRLAGSAGTWGATAHVTVDVAVVDELLAEDDLPAPAVVKMDIEGAEVEALAGMRETLRRHRPVLLIETHGRQREVLEILRAEDYDVTVLERPEVAPDDAPWGTHLVARPRAS